MKEIVNICRIRIIVTIFKNLQNSNYSGGILREYLCITEKNV